MKLKLSLTRAEGIALLSAVPDCKKFHNWAKGICISRNPDTTVEKIYFYARDGKRYTITPEAMMRGANLAIQPESLIDPQLKKEIQSGNFFASDTVLDTIIQVVVFGEVIFI